MPVMVIGSMVLAALVLARLTDLVHGQERTATTEQVLREASASLATSTGRHMMNRNTLQAVTRLADGADDLRVSMALVVDRSLQVVDAVGHLAEDAIGTATPTSTRCPTTWRRRSASRTAVSLDRRRPSISARGINFRPPCRARRSARVAERAERCDHRHHRASRCPVRPDGASSRWRRPCRSPSRARSSPRTSCVARASAGSGPWSRTPRTSCSWSPTTERITFVSPAAHRLLGFPDDDDPRHPSRPLGPPGGPARWPRHAARRPRRASVDSDRRSSCGSAMPTASYRWFEIRTRDLSDDAEIAGPRGQRPRDHRPQGGRAAAGHERGALPGARPALERRRGRRRPRRSASPSSARPSPSMLGHLPEDLVGTPAVDLVAARRAGPPATDHSRSFLGRGLPGRPGLAAEHRGAAARPRRRAGTPSTSRSPTCATSRRSAASCSTPATSPCARRSSTTCATRRCTTRSPGWPTAPCSPSG